MRVLIIEDRTDKLVMYYQEGVALLVNILGIKIQVLNIFAEIGVEGK